MSASFLNAAASASFLPKSLPKMDLRLPLKDAPRESELDERDSDDDVREKLERIVG